MAYELCIVTINSTYNSIKNVQTIYNRYEWIYRRTFFR